ncbi:MAG: hypothetical protein IIW06_08405, partial [Bacteroidaceae bacterium]|nr:hypothetical protein [Bacteroidaceae bacterium]
STKYGEALSTDFVSILYHNNQQQDTFQPHLAFLLHKSYDEQPEQSPEKNLGTIVHSTCHKYHAAHLCTRL